MVKLGGKRESLMFTFPQKGKEENVSPPGLSGESEGVRQWPGTVVFSYSILTNSQVSVIWMERCENGIESKSAPCGCTVIKVTSSPEFSELEEAREVEDTRWSRAWEHTRRQGDGLGESRAGENSLSLTCEQWVEGSDCLTQHFQSLLGHWELELGHDSKHCEYGRSRVHARGY